MRELDFDQGLVVVRRGKGDKDRSTLLAEVGRDELRAHLRESEAQHQADRGAGLAGVWMPDALDRKYPNAGRERAWFWMFSSRTCPADAARPRRSAATHNQASQPGVRSWRSVPLGLCSSSTHDCGKEHHYNSHPEQRRRERRVVFTPRRRNRCDE